MSFRLVGAMLSGSVRVDGGDTRIDRIRNGVLCGALTASSLAATPNPAPDLVGDRTVLDPMAFGVEEGGGMPRADVDVDGDGLETFSDADGDQYLDACIDGDGTVIDGSDCASDPRIADAYSAAFSLSAIWSILDGVAAPGCPAG